MGWCVMARQSGSHRCDRYTLGGAQGEPGDAVLRADQQARSRVDVGADHPDTLASAHNLAADGACASGPGRAAIGATRRSPRHRRRYRPAHRRVRPRTDSDIERNEITDTLRQHRQDRWREHLRSGGGAVLVTSTLRRHAAMGLLFLLTALWLCAACAGLDAHGIRCLAHRCGVLGEVAARFVSGMP